MIQQAVGLAAVEIGKQRELYAPRNVMRNRSVMTGTMMAVSALFVFQGEGGIAPVMTLFTWGVLASAVASRFSD